ncbi:glycoside hydrolase superfamily [Tribonema minus]|uniref:Glycoside hydrolase superfamily n=1 Tax=Tribonema minus TaxID=303371 RepID=A0A835ZB14_9STRA|nr:glycoside hydrolase superfamily [Tribonema minus]
MLWQTLTLEPYVPYHIMLYIWLPESECTTEIASTKCPQLLYHRVDTDEYTGAGVTVTAVGNNWNLISGTIWTAGDTNTVELRLQDIPLGAEVWVDDVILSRCGMEDFRPVSQRRVDEVRKRTVQLQLGDYGGGPDCTADITMKKHEYPFGGAMWDKCATEPECLKFFKKHFNYATAEQSMKWKESEPELGVYTHTDELVLAAVDKLDLKLRGHTVFWEVPLQVQDWWAMYHRIKRYTNKYGDVTVNDDVDNEMLHGSFFKELGVAPNVDVQTWAYKMMAYLVPGKTLFLNDYCMLVYCGPDITLSSIIKQAKGFPEAKGIGLQSHVAGGKEGLLQMERKIWVTEMDSQDTDLHWRGDAYESFYRAAYASAGVGGMLVWGWARHDGQWRPDQEMVDENFNFLEPGQRIFADDGLLHSEWNSTRHDVYFDDSKVYFDAFPGSYTVEVGDCVGHFKVPLGMGEMTAVADNWKCDDDGNGRRRKVRDLL